MRWLPSPPMLMTASTPMYCSLRSISSLRSTVVQLPSAFFTGHAKGPPLLVVPSMVPPCICSPSTVFSSSITISVGSRSTPLNDSTQPMTSQSLACAARFTMPRITAFSPGQSPPPVSTITRFSAIYYCFYYSLFIMHRIGQHAVTPTGRLRCGLQIYKLFSILTRKTQKNLSHVTRVFPMG